MTYFESTPEFRVLVSQEGQERLQVRYINQAQGYTGSWQDVPVVKENELSTSNAPSN